MKALTPIITAVIIILIALVLVALLWIFVFETFSSLRTSGESTVEETLVTISSCMKIDSVIGNKIFVRNCGPGSITEDTLEIYLDDIPLGVAMDPSIVSKDGIGTVSLSDLWQFNLGGHLLKVTNPNVITEQAVEAVLPDSCVLALDFEEGSGIKTYDRSGYENDGTLKNYTGSCGEIACPSWTTGRFGYGLEFDGIGDYVEVSDSPSLSISGNQITIESWFKASSVNDSAIVWKNYSTFSPIYGFSYFGESYGAIYGRITNTAENTKSVGFTWETDGQWHHLVMTYNGSIISLYMDGKFRKSDAFTGNILTSSSDVIIGDRETDHQYFNGTIDSVRIFNKALTPDELIVLKSVEYD
ncbi:MAG: LamG domain-containing protein [Candidatus Thorarchaeota archaeon]